MRNPTPCVGSKPRPGKSVPMRTLASAELRGASGFRPKRQTVSRYLEAPIEAVATSKV